MLLKCYRVQIFHPFDMVMLVLNPDLFRLLFFLNIKKIYSSIYIHLIVVVIIISYMDNNIFTCNKN